MAKFSDRAIKALALEPGQKDRLVFDEEVRGLGLRITAKSKTFLAQWTDKATGKKVREPIGVWGAITTDQARTAARAKFGEIARGLDPVAEKKRRKAEADIQKAEAGLTFDKLVTQCRDFRGSRTRVRPPHRDRPKEGASVVHGRAAALHRPCSFRHPEGLESAMAANAKTFRPGRSGNPSGRPRGARHASTMLAEKLMADDAENVVRAVIQAASNGDMQAARIVMDRLVPVRKGAPIAFDMPPIKAAEDVGIALGKVAELMAAGELSPEEASSVGTVIELRRKAIETSDLADRIAKLEEAHPR